MTETTPSTIASKPETNPSEHSTKAASSGPPHRAGERRDRAAERLWLSRASRRPLADLARLRPSGDPAADRLLHYLEQHVLEPGFKIDHALLTCGIRGNDFSSAFKRRCGKGLKELVTGTRIACAVELLADSPLTIRDIARLVGYRSSQGFQRAFSRRLGRTPRQVRQAHDEAPRPAHGGSKLSLAARHFPEVARRLARSLWKEVEAMATLDQASGLLECLDWQGDELFQVAEQRMLELRRQDPNLALRGNQLLLRLAEVQRQPGHWARARLQLGLTQYLLGGPEHLKAALAEIDSMKVRDPWIGLLQTQVGRLLRGRRRSSTRD